MTKLEFSLKRFIKSRRMDPVQFTENAPAEMPFEGSFNLLGLPLELREQVYEQLPLQKVYRRLLPNVAIFWVDYVHALSDTCKQMHSEIPDFIKRKTLRLFHPIIVVKPGEQLRNLTYILRTVSGDNSQGVDSLDFKEILVALNQGCQFDRQWFHNRAKDDTIFQTTDYAIKVPTNHVARRFWPWRKDESGLGSDFNRQNVPPEDLESLKTFIERAVIQLRPWPRVRARPVLSRGPEGEAGKCRAVEDLKELEIRVVVGHVDGTKYTAFNYEDNSFMDYLDDSHAWMKPGLFGVSLVPVIPVPVNHLWWYEIYGGPFSYHHTWREWLGKVEAERELAAVFVREGIQILGR